MRPFQQKIWMLSVVFWVGVLSWPLGVYLLMEGGVSPMWWVATGLTYLLVTHSMSVGYHRLLTHRAFRCNQFWHRLFTLVGCFSWHGSPIQWAALHTTHHRYPDGPGDPHYTNLSYLLHKRYRQVRLDLWRTRRLMRSRFHQFVHSYYVLIVLGGVYAACWVSPTAVLFGYLMPMGLLGLLGGLHQVIAHGVGSQSKYARNRPWLEFVLPSAGEWLHGHHHRKARDWDFRDAWWHLDTGALLVRLIRTDK